MYCNNSCQPITVTQLSSISMVFVAFQEQGGNWWIRCYPSVAYNASTQMRVKFYG